MNNRQLYYSGVKLIFSNFSKDPCLKKICNDLCPVGFTCIRVVPPRSGEFRLDLFDCNLNCPFCWTVGVSHLWKPEEIYEYICCRFKEFYTANLDVSINYLRITGGEPILNKKRVNHLLHVFKLIDGNVLNNKYYGIWKPRKSPKNLVGRRNIKIQTNGIKLPVVLKKITDDLACLQNICLTFEISLKGTNPKEFAILSGGTNGDMFFEQIQALNELIILEEQGCPIFVRGILGIFHSEQYDLVFPNQGMKMMLNPDPEFINVVRKLRTMSRAQERIYVEPLRFTEQMSTAVKKCKDIGILAKSEAGQSIKPGKKMPLSATYLNHIAN